MAKGRGGFIGQDGLNAPDSPTDVTGTAGDQQVSVAFTAPTDVGGSAITGYRVQDGTNAHGASGSSSPITVTGLTNGTSYTFNVWAINAFGFSAPSEASSSVSPFAPIGVFAGGYVTGGIDTNVIQKIQIDTTGNSTDYGDLSSAARMAGSGASTTRALYYLGEVSSSESNTIEYQTIATGGNTTDFGDTTRARRLGGEMGLSNNTRSVLGGGFDGTSAVDIIDYVTIASTGNSTDFGNLLSAIYRMGSCASPTRGLWAGAVGDSNVIQYITIASTGNATDFGDLTRSINGAAGLASDTRGVWGGGDNSNVMDYITIASTGNATDFGDLLATQRDNTSCCSNIRGIFGGGSTHGDMNYITIASTGNATDFGDMVYGFQRYTTGTSSDHGGLQ